MSKKGIMAIETMIIFIAIVLVAAVAAGLLIRQSGLLQQRSVAVSDEARERMVTGIEVLNINAQSDLENQTLNDLELLVRLKAGSNPIQMKDVNLMLTTPTYTESAILLHPDSSDLFSDINIVNVPNSTINNGTEWLTISNMETDNKKDVGVNTEKIQLLVNDSVDGTEKLRVDLSYASNNDDPYLESLGFIVPGQIFDIDLGVDLSSPNATSVNVFDLPIQNPVSNDVYGYITISGTANYNNSLKGLTAVITSNPRLNSCDFDSLVPNKRFCITTRVGANDDTRLERGELMSIKYRVKREQSFNTEMLYELKIIPKGGSIESITAITPAVLVLQTTTLWG